MIKPAITYGGVGWCKATQTGVIKKNSGSNSDEGTLLGFCGGKVTAEYIMRENDLSTPDLVIYLSIYEYTRRMRSEKQLENCLYYLLLSKKGISSQM